MHIFVINLEKDIARRESIVGQLETLGLPYEIVPAVYGAALSAEERARHYDERKAKWRLSRILTPAEIGIALSHLKIYRLMIERGIEYAMILEDDVMLPSDLGKLLDECGVNLEPTKPSVWLLSPATGRKNAPCHVSIGSSHRLFPYQNGYYASSYILTLTAARALLAELYPVSDVADCWLRMHRYRVVDIFIVTPPLIVQDQDGFGSSTTSSYYESIRSDLVPKAIYKLRRLRAIIFDLFYARYRRWFRPYSGINLKHTE